MSDDRDNITHRVDNWEELLNMSDPLEEMPSFATAETPLRVYLPTTTVQRIIRDVTHALQRKRSLPTTAPEMKAQLDALIAQRAAMLVWLKQRKDKQVFLALYPVSKWTFKDTDEDDDDEAEAWRGDK